MNKLDREVAQVCDRLTDKGARGVILLIVELSGAFKRLLHHLLGSDRKGGRV